MINNRPVSWDSEFDVMAAADSRPSILIDGAHHARELTSISMVMYTMIRLLHGYLNSDSQTNQILGTSGIYFIPIVNWDSVKLISDTFAKNGRLDFIRKNRHESNQVNCVGEDIGVDLNRNYGYKFGVDNEGSENLPCSEDYRGPKAFSEAETRAIRDFVSALAHLNIALNFHAWGNLFVIPFNYSDD